MTSAEFAEWEAYQRLVGPLTERREDWRFAMVASVVANGNRDAKKRRRPYEPHEFIPDWAASAGVEKPKPSPLEVAEKVKAGFRRLAARRGAGRR